MKNEYAKLPWSVEDTIENLKEIKEHLKSVAKKTNLHGKGKEDAKEIDFDFDRAIKALETMAEMKKRNITTETIIEYAKFEDECVQKGFTFKSLLEAREKQTQEYVVFQDNCGNSSVSPRCLKCFEIAEHNYCDNCGQKLRWGD